MSLTAAQQKAVTARGNVLVMAGAGTGKTRTLVERCIDCLLNEQPRVGLEEILLVTFTEAAAAEMRERIHSRLELQVQQTPDDPYWQEQLALFETAKIGTLHSFCLQLVRQHFYELELDPQLVVMPEEEGRLLAEETLEELLQKYYRGAGPRSEEVLSLIESHMRGSDKPLRLLLLRLHKYSQSLPDPESWLKKQIDVYSEPEPAVWRPWLAQELINWHTSTTKTLTELAKTNNLAVVCSRVILEAGSPQQLQPAGWASLFEALVAAVPRQKTRPRKALEELLSDASFLRTLLPSESSADPLKEDWDWVRAQMKTLLELTGEFTDEFRDAKRELGVVDFSDLEQYSLKLLWDATAGQPTQTALAWRKQLRFVFVDEYQDINAAQDRIIEALSRAGEGNRFLVGDVKQSIYRFRLANPHIFQRYIRSWGQVKDRTIPLQDNFRSREEILSFVNSVSETWMRSELGGLVYDQQARLISGLKNRDKVNAATWAVELRLRIKGAIEEEAETEENDQSAFAEMEEAAKEARLIGGRLKELIASRHPVWDEALTGYRPVEWRDMAILLRSPRNKAESYAKEFAFLDIPLEVSRGGFYESIEISDLLSILQVLDNPLQDIPLLAVLRSPIVGLSLEELADIRQVLPRGYFWAALLRWAEIHSADSSLPGRRIARFLKNFAEWRTLGRQLSLSECIEHILNQTGYSDWLATMPRSHHRLENVKRFVLLAQRFDQLQRQGLFRFLRFIEAQRQAEAEPETAAVDLENSVRLMSIHQSKGLEFPVVVLADLGKAFNFADLRSDIILDEELGLAPEVLPPNNANRYPSLPHWMASRRQQRELLGEELRLLYVAMTRARDLLLLSGSTSRGAFRRIWSGEVESALAPHKARSFADWIGGWFRAQAGGDAGLQGENSFLRWSIHDDRALASIQGAQAAQQAIQSKGIQHKTAPTGPAFEYPYTAATKLPAKTSVSTVRRQALAVMEGEQGVDLFQGTSRRPRVSLRGAKKGSAVDVGNAHHHFLEKMDLGPGPRANKKLTESDLQSQARLLLDRGILAKEELGVLDFKALARFWDSEVGRSIRAHSSAVGREVPFTFRLPAQELASLSGQINSNGLAGDFVVIQGVADLMVKLENEIWILDFKTDQPSDTEDQITKYKIQLQLYARALSAAFKKPVTHAWLHFLASGQTADVATDVTRPGVPAQNGPQLQLELTLPGSIKETTRGTGRSPGGRSLGK